MKIAEFFVPGIPKPAGSKRGFALKKGGVFTGRVAIVDDCKGSRDWKTDVKRTAISAVIQQRGGGFSPIEGPISIEVDFYLPRPKKHFNSRGDLRPGSPEFPIVKPDATKLLRGVEDALTGIIWRDDAQIVRQVVEKTYTSGTPGVAIRISTE